MIVLIIRKNLMALVGQFRLPSKYLKYKIIYSLTYETPTSNHFNNMWLISQTITIITLWNGKIFWKMEDRILDLTLDRN